MTPTKSIHRILALATLAATAFLSQALHAQVNTYPSRVNVPFAFNCGSQHFYPGIYTIRMVNSNVLSVSNLSEAGMVMVQSDPGTSGPAQGYLTFRRYGNRYFLAEYHPANSFTSATIVRSTTERSIAHDFASNQAADQGRVRLALLENGAGLSSGR